MMMLMTAPSAEPLSGYDMKLCPDCAPGYTCCDHCAYYNFNGDTEGRYTGEGWCRFHKEKRDPGSDCEEYVCFQLLNPEGVEPKHE